jgi:tripartite-type tricarboxylate transporter receptor subunit TctC
LALIQAGKLEPLAVSSSSRSSLLPNVLTVAELGFPEATYNFWIGMFAPDGTPDVVLDRLHTEAAAALELPALKERFVNMGQEPMPMTRKAFADYVTDDLVRNVALVKAANIASTP